MATGECGAGKRDWVNEAYECFIKDREGCESSNPVKAIEAYFAKNATEELKERCKAEGKDAKGCWDFITAVARRALGGQSGHIDPGVVYAIAMHWFEDVPADWDLKGKAKCGKTGGETSPQAAKHHAGAADGGGAAGRGGEGTRQDAPLLGHPLRGRPAAGGYASPCGDGGTREGKKPRKKNKPAKRKRSQGFFFDMLDMQPCDQKTKISNDCGGSGAADGGGTRQDAASPCGGSGAADGAAEQGSEEETMEAGDKGGAK